MDSENLYFLMEFAEKGTLYDLIKNVYGTEPVPVDTSRFFLAEIVLALESLHRDNYVHRDLKPQNILVHKSFHLKLCDFGEAK